MPNRFESSCPQCGQLLEYPAELAGQIAACPACHDRFMLAVMAKDLKSIPSSTISRTCIRCGVELSPDAVLCVNCGTRQDTGASIATRIHTQSEDAIPDRPALHQRFTKRMVAGVVTGLILAGVSLSLWKFNQRVHAGIRAITSSQGQPHPAASLDYDSLLYDETNHPAQGKKPFPWLIPAGYHLRDSQICGYSDPSRRIFVGASGEYVGYCCSSGTTMKIFINGNEMSSFESDGTNIPIIVFSSNFKHWVSVSRIKDEFSNGMIVDGKQAFIQRAIFSPIISFDGRHTICAIVKTNGQKGIMVDGGEKTDVADNKGFMFIGSNSIPVLINGRNWIFGNRQFTNVLLQSRVGDSEVMRHAFFIVGPPGDQFVWADGVEYEHFDEVLYDQSIQIHPVSEKLMYIAKRKGKSYFFFAGHLSGPFDSIDEPVKVSADGNHFAFFAEMNNTRMAIYDGDEADNQDEKAMRLLDSGRKYQELWRLRDKAPNYQPYFSADGEHMAYTDNYSSTNAKKILYVIVSEKGKSPPVDRFQGSNPFVFSPDGLKINYLAFSNDYWFVGVDNEAGSVYKTNECKCIMTPQFTPDSKFVFYEVRLLDGGCFFVVNNQRSKVYERRVSAPVICESGVGLYVLNDREITFLKMP